MLKRVMIAAAICSMSMPAFAQQWTPNHVFQKAIGIRSELSALNAANFSQAEQIYQLQGDYAPRHVYMLARTVWNRTQLLRFMNSLETNALEPIPGRTIRLDEIYGLVETTLHDVYEMRPAYGLSGELAISPLPAGKTPTDVYGELLGVLNELSALGIPATVPNDVYQVAFTLRTVLEETYTQMGGSPYHNARPYFGKTSSDVYDEAVELIQDMVALAESDPRFDIPGGVPAPAARSGPVGPDQAVVILSRALGDAVALKLAAGVQTETPIATYQGGKTPADVYQLLVHCRALLDKLAEPPAS